MSSRTVRVSVTQEEPKPVRQRPILFSAPMVRALLEGRKTQTRRVVKPQPVADREWVGGAYWETRAASITKPIAERLSIVDAVRRCPYGAPGDRLWVRETWGAGSRPDPFDGWRDGVEYRADEHYLGEGDMLPLNAVELPSGVDLDSVKSGWRPSIYMPRWASRIDLEVVSVRVERVQEISYEDVMAEGAEAVTHRDFGKLWDSINGKRAPWSSNPWVWVVEFKRVAP